MKSATRTITVTGMLSAIAIVLGLTPLGLIPVPTLAGRATIMHIPVIIGAILEGPMVGMFVGLIFGMISFITAASPLLKNPIIAILPRILIGLFAYYAYRWTRSSVLSALIGGITNTIGVLIGCAIQTDSSSSRVGIALTHGVPEAIVGALITVIVVKALKLFQNWGIEHKSRQTCLPTLCLIWCMGILI